MDTLVLLLGWVWAEEAGDNRAKKLSRQDLPAMVVACPATETLHLATRSNLTTQSSLLGLLSVAQLSCGQDRVGRHPAAGGD
jgi:hypothetical protein